MRVQRHCLLLNPLSPVRTGDEIEFNTVDFVESHKVDRVALVPCTLATKFNVSAIKLTVTNCRIHVVADLLSVYSATVDRVEFNFVAVWAH